MAKFRLRSAHQLRNAELNADVWLPGDKETEHLGDERGTVVGTGTPYPVVAPTLEMTALDKEAEALLAIEEQRLTRAHGSMNPVDQLSVTLQQLSGVGRDDYEDRYLPGFAGTPRPQAKAQPDSGAG